MAEARGERKLARPGGVAILMWRWREGRDSVKILREKLGLTQDELDELLEKAFTAVDGLWFLGIEEGVAWWGNLKRAGREKIVRCREARPAAQD